VTVCDDLAATEVALADADLLVAHVEDSQWNDLIRHARKGGCSVRVSSESVRDRHRTTDSGVVLLSMRRRHPEIESKDWVAVLERLLEEGVPGAVVKGVVPQDLQPYVGAPASDLLLALSVLCQGYLAVHGGPGGVLEGDVDPKSVQTLTVALRQMGWIEALSSGRGLAPHSLDNTEAGKAAREALRNQGRVS
jgi:hypothetical protein